MHCAIESLVWGCEMLIVEQCLLLLNKRVVLAEQSNFMYVKHRLENVCENTRFNLRENQVNKAVNDSCHEFRFYTEFLF